MKSIKNSSRIVAIILVFAMITLLSFNSQKDDSEKRFYYAFNEKVQIEQVVNKILVKKKTTLAKSNYEEVAKQLLGEIKIEWFNNDISEIELKDLKNKEEKVNSLISDDEVLSVRSIYKTSDNLEFGLSDEIIVKFKDEIKDSEKEKILTRFNLKKSKTTKIYESVTISKNDDIIEVANKLYESGNFIFAYPNIICKAELFSTFPNDPYFQFQVTCHNTGQTFNGHSGTPDADIDAPEAWDITTGNNNIIIAVFDEGVTSDHPDLPNTRQVRLNGSNFGSGDVNNPSPTGNDNHGNSCAGVIGATMNNNQGIAGIAPNCRIMPLRWDGTTTSDEMADGIEFAVNNGANIISNSWGYGTSNNNYIPAIVTAIQYAINNNVVVVFAAGNTARHNSCNDNGYVTFPANANVDGLLTVGASDRYDNQSDYSPTNALIDIVAPSHRAYPPETYIAAGYDCGGISGETFEMWTLDIPGDAGYNSWPSAGIHPPSTGETLPNTGTNYLSYTGRFGGTSHACPVVAGVAALLLSVNPNLTPQQVFNILTGTADKIGSYTYVNGRCNETGYGRVNAFAAVQAATCTTTSFVNQTVTTNTTVVGCNVNVQNVNVQNNAKLTIDAQNETTINGTFEVQLGSSLDIN
ncbi:MAG: S8 family serine peptidase [Prolixibacteraceae bacterium]|nr:S8 family serine peptidase [Prolixibacteraceae bacterium]